MPRPPELRGRTRETLLYHAGGAMYFVFTQVTTHCYLKRETRYVCDRWQA